MSPARQDVGPLTRREQLSQARSIFLTILIAGPILFTLADLLKG